MITDKICSKCVLWTRIEDKDYDGTKSHGSCSSPFFVYTGDCDVAPTNGLAYWDVESYMAGFTTGENFGCIHFAELNKGVVTALK